MDKKGLLSQVVQQCIDQVQLYKGAIAECQKAANSEVKSSVGDKYETSRAMAQNDISLYQSRLEVAQNNLSLAASLTREKVKDEVKKGALVQTSIGWLLMGLALGEVSWEGQKVICMSIEAPLAKVLYGKKMGEKISFNGRELDILLII